MMEGYNIIIWKINKKKKMNFKNKNVFISGATHGIGLSCILDFAKLGANVITFSRDKNFFKKSLTY